MKTNKTMMDQLAVIAPSIAIQTIWEHDEDTQWSEIADSMEGESPDDWQAWQSEVRASAIVDGKLIYNSAYLAGTWEKYGDNPRESNPDISGYLPQMIEEALSGLNAPLLADQIKAAKGFVNAEMKQRYDAQRKGLEVA